MGFINDFEINDIKNKPIKTEEIKIENKLKKIDYDDIIPEDERVSMVRKVELSAEDYQDFTEEKYPNSINFYDFEVFQYDWMVVIINPVERIKTVIVNNSKELKRYYNRHKNQIWCGYNSRNYDTFIMKSILLDINPKFTNDMIIGKGMKGWQIDERFRDIQFYDYDVMSSMHGLKQLEAFMGNDIRETTIPFDLDRKLTHKEIRETIKYCMHDVEQTLEVFRLRKDDFNAHIDLIETFNLPLDKINLTQAQLTAIIIGCKKQERDDEFDLQFVECLQISKYKHILDWFKNRVNRNYKNSLTVDVCGIPHTFGWGGLHGCPEKPLHSKGKIYHIDVTSYYPSIMIEYDFLTRNCKNKNKFKQIYDKRVELKKQGKKKEQAPYKIILNGTYGICKDKYSLAFDPLQANNVCVNGQLMLLDLLEHLEPYCEIIQSNTDGIILQVYSDENEKKMKEVCQDWMKRTKMGLGFDEIDEIFQKDVNNYCFRFTNGKLERKGAYVKELDNLDFDLPIVNKAVVDYLMKGIEPYDTIENCNELKQFQKVIKISSNYLYGWHNDRFLTDKTFRVFASKNKDDTYIGKVKTEGGTIEKFANTPEHCMIINENINGMECVKNLDKKWYVDLATKRLKDFGIEIQDEFSLF
jgi:hypothetical protein